MNLKNKGIIFYCLCHFVLTGCVSGLTVDHIQEFNPQSKVFVLLETSRWDMRIRKELTKKGFKVLKSATVNKVIARGSENEIARVYNEAAARYGLSFYWEQVDRCVYNSSRLINGIFEITDLQTNEVLLVIETGGWTGPCADPRGMVFVGLAEALANEWGK